MFCHQLIFKSRRASVFPVRWRQTLWLQIQTSPLFCAVFVVFVVCVVLSCFLCSQEDWDGLGFEWKGKPCKIQEGPNIIPFKKLLWLLQPLPHIPHLPANPNKALLFANQLRIRTEVRWEQGASDTQLLVAVDAWWHHDARPEDCALRRVEALTRHVVFHTSRPHLRHGHLAWAINSGVPMGIPYGCTYLHPPTTAAFWKPLATQKQTRKHRSLVSCPARDLWCRPNRPTDLIDPRLPSRSPSCRCKSPRPNPRSPLQRSSSPGKAAELMSWWPSGSFYVILPVYLFVCLFVCLLACLFVCFLFWKGDWGRLLSSWCDVRVSFLGGLTCCSACRAMGMFAKKALRSMFRVVDHCWILLDHLYHILSKLLTSPGDSVLDLVLLLNSWETSKDLNKLNQFEFVYMKMHVLSGSLNVLFNHLLTSDCQRDGHTQGDALGNGRHCQGHCDENHVDPAGVLRILWVLQNSAGMSSYLWSKQRKSEDSGIAVDPWNDKFNEIIYTSPFIGYYQAH